MLIIKGTIRMEISPLWIGSQRNAGAQDTAIIHEILDRLLAQLDPMTRQRISFHDCEIKDSEERSLPF